MRFILLFSVLIALNAGAAQKSWDKLKTGERYKLIQNLNFQSKDRTFRIKKGTKLRLVENTSLSMIKVQLHRYKIDNCVEGDLESDLELVSIKGNKDLSVGMNMSKGCILEVFVEKKDFKNKSLVL